jgi:hypothetical protein
VNINVYLPLIAALLLSVVGPALARRLPPGVAARMLTLASVVAAATSVSSLTLLAVTALAQIPDIATRGQLSRSVMAHDPVSLTTGVLAAFTLLVLVPFAVHAAVQLYRETTRAYKLAKAFSEHPSTIAVVPDPRPQAFAVPGIPAIPGRDGIPARIIVTDSLLRTLDPAQRRAMFAHEQAHLDRRHHLYLMATRVAAIVNPLLFRLPEAVTEATERWADEDAAAAVGDRGVLARAIGRAALSSVAAPAPLPSMASAHVGARVRALLAPPPPRRRALSVVVGVTLAATAFAALDSAHEADDFFDAARSAWQVTHVHTGPGLG